MEKDIKFVHCADIHLGANPFEIEERFEDMGKAFFVIFSKKCYTKKIFNDIIFLKIYFPEYF